MYKPNVSKTKECLAGKAATEIKARGKNLDQNGE